MSIMYEMINEKGETVCKARSEHVFLNSEGRFARLKREMPEYCAAVDASLRG